MVLTAVAGPEIFECKMQILHALVSPHAEIYKT